VQGEGRFAGLPMQFVRAFGCNLDCSWCDTPAALTTHPGAARFFEQDNESIAELISRHPIDVPACFTGGEPFMQSQHMWEVQEIVRRMDTGNGALGPLNHKKRLLTVETNGTRYHSEFAKEFYLSMSPKFDSNADKLLNLAEETIYAPLTAHGQDAIKKWVDSSVPMHFKFVVLSERQFSAILDWVQKIVPNLLRRGTIPLYFQPEWFNGKEDFKKTVQKWVECEHWRTILQMGFEEVRFVPQTHKMIGVR
jgi:organic radical activating enzyme